MCSHPGKPRCQNRPRQRPNRLPLVSFGSSVFFSDGNLVALQARAVLSYQKSPNGIFEAILFGVSTLFFSSSRGSCRIIADIHLLCVRLLTPYHRFFATALLLGNTVSHCDVHVLLLSASTGVHSTLGSLFSS